MVSIFSPRTVVDKDGVVKLRLVENNKEFDKYYYDYTVKKVIKKIGEGEEDYIEVEKIIEDKKDIRELIESQAPDVGLEAMLDRYAKTGDPSVLPSPIHATDQIFDTTKLPQDNAEYFEYIHSLADKFEALPVELRKDLTVDDFIRQVTDKQVNDWLESVKPQVKKGENDDE